jgi:hypothetical protein
MLSSRKARRPRLQRAVASATKTHAGGQLSRTGRPARLLYGIARSLQAPEKAVAAVVDRSELRRRQLAAAEHSDYAAAVERAVRTDDQDDWLAAADLFDELQGVGTVSAPGWPVQLQTLLADRLSLHGRRIEAFVQRGERGWADSDLIALDHHLASVISGSLRASVGASEFYGGPMREPWPTTEAWESQLVALAECFDFLAMGGNLVPGDDGRLPDPPVIEDAFAQLAAVWRWLFY